MASIQSFGVKGGAAATAIGTRSVSVPQRPRVQVLPASKRNASTKMTRALPLRAMVADASPESTAIYAKEMERVAAKEALLLAIKDAGGASALSPGPGNPASIIDVGEKLLSLEKLNPTPRPTSSPLLEGNWDFVWVGARSPGITAARILLQRFPAQVATLDSLSLQISGDGTTATAIIKFFNTVETTITLKSNLSAEGPLKVKEEYAEGLVSTPSVPDGSLPDSLKPVLDQLASASANLPGALKDALTSGLKLPLSGRYSRELILSYLDDEVLVARDQFGSADVLVKAPVTPTLVVESVAVETIEYVS